MSLTLATERPFKNTARQVNKLMDQMKGYYNFYGSETWTPNVNLYENDTAYLVCVDLAGVDKEKIDLEVIDQKLTLRGNRAVPLSPEGVGKEGAEAPRLRVHLMEIDHGGFSREVELPFNVERDRISATYLNGMLWIELPKKA